MGNTYLTHYLTDEANDPVMNRIRSLNLHNSVNDKVKVFFVPSYLNGDDGVFNMPYYDLLIGMDLTAFPSYYEPWGYTPLESLAFKVPTLTTTLAGFGLWVKEHYNMAHPGIEVVRRGDNDNAKVITAIAEWVRNYTVADGQTRVLWRQNAKSVSQIALWDNLITYYRQAYSFALEQVDCRLKDMQVPAEESVSYIEKQLTVNNPSWVSVMIHRSIPEKLGALEELCQNLWWCWHDEARELFRMVDADVWRKCGHNPIALLDSISLNRYQELENDSEFVNKLPQGIDAPITQGGTNVSGGQKQRLSIARALARKPEILIFDDSFSALDYKTDATLRKGLSEELGDTTRMIVAQRIGTIRHADKIVVLDEGKAVGIGTHEELLKNCPVYREIAMSQLSEEELNA